MLIISGSNQQKLATEIASIFGLDSVKADILTFNDGELNANISYPLFRHKIIIIQSTHTPVNDNLMELLLISDAARRGGAGEIVAIVPYFGYSRQDRLFQNNQSLSRSLAINILKTAGIDRIVTLDIHSQKINDLQNNISNISVLPTFLDKLKELKGDNTILVSPDRGSIARTKQFSEALGLDYVSINKTRMPDGSCVMDGSTQGLNNKDFILIDDIVDSADTLSTAVDFLIQNGAKSVDAFVTHAVLSKNALKLINNSPLRKLYVTDSIVHESLPEKIEVVGIKDAIAKYIEHFEY
jgi:ribose-phosphate pyrophosphokinase